MRRVCTTHGVINAFKISVKNMNGREHLKHSGTDGKKVIFKCILKKTAAGTCEYGTKKPTGCHNGKGNVMNWVAISISMRTLWHRVQFVVVCFTFEHGKKHLKQHSDSGKKHMMFTWAFIVQEGNSKAVFRRMQISAICCLIPDSVPGVASCQTSSQTLTLPTSEME